MSDFFTPVANTKPYIKIGLQGFAGSGKTHTASLIAIGLHKQIGSKKPIVMFDTEKSAKFLKPLFEEAGIQLMIKESRTLADLKTTMQLMKDGYSDILIIDSISHIWEDTIEAFKTKANRTTLQFQDWGILKPLWKREFSEPFVNFPFHVVMCGRAGYEYENEINAETGKREIYKSGIKMKVEGETNYEPDLLILMERFENLLGDKKETHREATVIKDRSRLIDGAVFTNPTYEDIKPAIDIALSEPTKSTSIEQNSTSLIKTEEDRGKYIRDKNILLEEIQAAIVEKYPSTKAEDKTAKAKLIKDVFGTGSWTKVEGMRLEDLKLGLDKIHATIAEANVDRSEQDF